MHSDKQKKNIPLKQRKINIISSGVYKNLRDYTAAFEAEPSFSNPFVTTMQDYYKEILDIAWTNLDPNELASLKKYTKEIREKAKDLEDRLKDLGPPLPSGASDKMHLLWNMITDFVTIYKNTITGKFDSKRYN